jgi:hypothetical protein
MLGALLSLLVCEGFGGIGGKIVAKLRNDLDPAESIGLAGLFGLAILGWATLPLGLLPGGFHWGIWLVAAGALTGYALLFKQYAKRLMELSAPMGAEWLFVVALSLCALVALVGVLGPSDSNDWDSLAYHLAVPKLWLEAGRIEFVPSIHHSNFPLLVDNLYVWGLSWSGQSGAKGFAWAYAMFGGVALFGLARRKYGRAAGWWAVLAFASIPTVLWESGTAYVDVAHGLWAGFGVLYGAEFLSKPNERGALWLSALCLGFACASKYTGLQVLAAVGLALLVGGVLAKRLGDGVRNAATVGTVALALCSPWLIKNLIWTGNPVYPFFYEVFDGKNWDQDRADIYRNEQLTFGVGRTDSSRDWTKFPHAVLGLAYQPGRYVNPGQTQGLGMPTGALGFAVVAALLLWPLSGRLGRFEKAVLGTVVVCFILWFALSQQSRYGLNMGIPLAFLLGGAVAKIRAGPILAVAAACQAGYSLWLVKAFTVEPKLPVVMGSITERDYLMRAAPFHEPAQEINMLAAEGKVALYDEVFGFFLDVPYFWANPGHSTQIPYERLESGASYADEMAAQGFTHVYVSFGYKAPEDVRRWVSATGLDGSPIPYEGEERAELLGNFEQRWKVLVAEAVLSRRLAPVWATGKGVLFELRQ